VRVLQNQLWFIVGRNVLNFILEYKKNYMATAVMFSNQPNIMKEFDEKSFFGSIFVSYAYIMER